MTDLCLAGDYHWHAAKITAVDGRRGEAQLHPVPANGPEVVEFDLSLSGHIRWLSEKQRFFFFVSVEDRPIPNYPKRDRIRLVFKNDRPHPDSVVGWVYEASYADAQKERLADPRRNQRGHPR